MDNGKGPGLFHLNNTKGIDSKIGGADIRFLGYFQ